MKRLARVSVFLLIAVLISGLSLFDRVTSAGQTNDSGTASLDFVPGRILVRFRPETPGSQRRQLITMAGAVEVDEIRELGIHILELGSGGDEKALARGLKTWSEVEFAEVDQILQPASTIPNDFWYPSEWHLPRIAANDAWPISTGSENITIAILDTGVDGSHPDLSAKMVAGWNVYNNNADTSDVHGHGTQVAGAAAASSNNGIGVTSIAWNCRIMPVRISDATGNATYSNMANGLIWAADHGARVANISYMASNSATVRSAAQYMQSRGGVVTAAAGNYSTFDSSPDNPYILTVSATNPSDLLSDFSNYGNNIDVAAPEGVYTTTRGGGYSYQGGTSFSAPIVAGIAALVLSKNSSLTAMQVQDIIKQNSDDLGAPGWDISYGWGRVNAARAVANAGGDADATAPTVGFSSPTNGATVQGSISIQLTATDNNVVSSVTVSVDGGILGTDSTSPYSLLWDTTGVNNVVHTVTATARDAAGNSATASIIVSVNNQGDATPPTISITSPSNGVAVSGNVSILVSTTDNVGVVKVELYVDAELAATTTAMPFNTKWNTKRASRGAHTLQTRAYDAAGNFGLSQIVTVYK